MSVARAGGGQYTAIKPNDLLLHPCTGIAKQVGKPDGLSDKALSDKVLPRIMRKANYEKVSDKTYKPLSALSKFNYFSAASRNANSTARAYHESGHIFTAAFLREVGKDPAVAKEATAKKTKEQNPNQDVSVPDADAVAVAVKNAENEVWEGFKEKTGLQRTVKRQDFLNHRLYMFDEGEQIKPEPTQKTNETSGNNTTENPAQPLLNNKTQGNRFARIATKFSRFAMSVCECTSAPTGFTYRAGRNLVFHGATENGQINKAGTVMASFAIGMAAAAIIKAIRGAAGTSGYGFNPIQMLTGVLVAFAAVSGLAGCVSWLAGLGSQAILKNRDIEPSKEQKRVLQFDMDSTINKINQLILTYKDNPAMLDCISKAMRSEMPKQAGGEKKAEINGLVVCPLLAEWHKAIIPDLTNVVTPEDKQIAWENALKNALPNAKKNIGAYLLENTGNDRTGNHQPQTAEEKKIAFNKEKEFAALAGLVEHFETDPTEVSEADRKFTKDSIEQAQGNDLGKYPKTIHTLRADRVDGRQFTEQFAQKINRTLLRGLAKPAVLLDLIFKTENKKISNTLKRYGSDSYANDRRDSLKDRSKAHLHKYHAEYIAAHLHQYGPITRALMKASDLIHNVNYNYILAVNAQTSRLYNKAAQAFQESVLGQHSSKIACSALGRFLGGMTVTLVAFFGISTLAALTGGGSASAGFTNTAQMGSAKMSWLVTGTLMTLVGLPAFALGLMAKGAARLEGWKGDIDASIPKRFESNIEAMIKSRQLVII